MNSFVRTTRLLSELRPVFKRWVTFHHKYVKYWEGTDCAWWHNERASTGVFAIAAWRPGEVALEEYGAKKGVGKDNYMGRSDLYLTNRSHDFVVEAKQSWITLAQISDGLDDISNNLDQACRDAMRSSDPVSRRIGVVFVVPRFRVPVQRDRNRIVKMWLKELEAVSSDAFCWASPKEALKLKAEGLFYPGVALIARAVKKSR